MSDGEKICVLCGLSCAGQARTKNEQGQYAHMACVKARQEQQQGRVDDGLGDEALYGEALGGGMDDLLGDIDSPEAIDSELGGAAMACPGCGQRMDAGAVVCMACGYNTQSGRSMSTKSKEVKPGGGATGAALGGVAKVGGAAASPMLPFVGALIGGAIGAAV